MTSVRTTAVGSWPPPFGQRPALRPFWKGEVGESDPAVSDALEGAARVAMDEMLACGLDQITGGEVFAPDFVHTVPPRLTGVTADRLRDVGRGQQGVARYRVTAPSRPRMGLDTPPPSSVNEPSSSDFTKPPCRHRSPLDSRFHLRR